MLETLKAYLQADPCQPFFVWTAHSVFRIERKEQVELFEDWITIASFEHLETIQIISITGIMPVHGNQSAAFRREVFRPLPTATPSR